VTGHGRPRDRGLTHALGRGPTHAHARDHTRAAADTHLTRARRPHAAVGLVPARASAGAPLPLVAGEAPAKSLARLSLTISAALSPLSISPTFLATMAS
jgi:hypothetical protein